MDRLTEYESIGGHAHAVPTGNIDTALMRLAAYEDTGYTPEEIKKLQGDLIMSNAELLKTREELKEHYDSISQLDGANSSLMAANEKLAADRKALINELCQYCGKYKQAHKGACDGCKWKQ